MVDIKKKKTVRDRFLLTGPTFAGKTQLYYKLSGGAIDVSLSSSDINENADNVSVKVPNRLVSNSEASSDDNSSFVKIDAKFVDVPGHYNFKK